MKILKSWTFSSCIGIASYVVPEGCEIEKTEAGTPWDNCWDWGDGDTMIGARIFLYDEKPSETPSFIEFLLSYGYLDKTDGNIFWKGEWNMDSSNPQPV